MMTTLMQESCFDPSLPKSVAQQAKIAIFGHEKFFCPKGGIRTQDLSIIRLKKYSNCLKGLGFESQQWIFRHEKKLLPKVGFEPRTSQLLGQKKCTKCLCSNREVSGSNPSFMIEKLMIFLTVQIHSSISCCACTSVFDDEKTFIQESSTEEIGKTFKLKKSFWHSH